MGFKYRASVGQLPWPLRGKRALVICCGSGMDSEFLERDGAIVIGLDISEGALRRAQQRAHLYGLRYRLVQGDAENLPFGAAAVEVIYVHDGLHHLERPEKALEEMARVGSRAVLVTEPADAVLTKAAIALRLIPEREESGNLVARIDAGSMQRQFAALGLTSFRPRRYLLKYGHPPARWWRCLDWPPLFAAAKGAFLLFGVGLFGAVGNKISVAAFRAEQAPVQRAAKLIPE